MKHVFETDQDVCHIIASANGGADHPDNYVVLGREFNRCIGARYDHLMCYIAGKEKCQKAVEASMRRYEGPSADSLYAKGKELMKRIRS